MQRARSTSDGQPLPGATDGSVAYTDRLRKSSVGDPSTRGDRAAGERWIGGVQCVVCVLMAPALYFVMYLIHFSGPAIPTGFLTEDMPYYSANGRAVFERGNGLAGPNPYDPDPAAPSIYFHWFTWMLGFGSSVLGIDPGFLFFGIGVLASILVSCLTLQIVKKVAPDTRFRYTLFFLAMWGGGVLCLGKFVVNIAHGRYPLVELFAFDPYFGWWCLYWGRNLLLPNEAVFHAVVAATWLAVLCDRRPIVLLGAALLATTHPWSGLQLLLILGAWYGGLAIFRGGRPNRLMLLALSGMLLLFLGYYFVFLTTFEQHRALQRDWTLTWVLPVKTIILAYGPIGLLAVWRMSADKFCVNDMAWFFATCFAVSFLLSKHEWFFTAHQPLHFTRGYAWLPLLLIALPLIQKGLVWSHERMPPLVFWLGYLIVGGLAISDNVAYVHGWWKVGRIGYSLTPSERDVFDNIRRHQLDGVLLCPDQRLSYLTATYTRVRPYYGHDPNTPNYTTRHESVKLWHTEGTEGSWFDRIDFILLSKHGQQPEIDLEAWDIVVENADCVLFQRKNRRKR